MKVKLSNVVFGMIGTNAVMKRFIHCYMFHVTDGFDNAESTFLALYDIGYFGYKPI